MAAPLLPAPPHLRKDYAGFEDTIKQCAAYIRKYGDDPNFQQFANAIVDKVYPRSRHTSHLEIAQALLDYCNDNIRFRPDPPNTELVKSPAIILCVPGAVACIPVEDCEATDAAYLALCRAMGIEVKLLLQKLWIDTMPKGEEEQWHLAGKVRLDSGEWVIVDPSLKGRSRVGQSQKAVGEQEIDPLDPQWSGAEGGAKFVAIGARPGVIWVREERAMYRKMSPAPPMIGACCQECADAQQQGVPPGACQSGSSTCGGPKRKKPAPPAALGYGRPVFDAAGRNVIGPIGPIAR